MAKDTNESTELKSTKEATVSSAKPATEMMLEHSAGHHYSDMAKMSAGLLVGVLALMTFLLSVGLQHPKPMIRSFLYASFIALGLTLLVYQLGCLLEARAAAKAHGAAAEVTSSRRSLAMVRVLQQFVFAVAIIATVGFAIAASQLFFVTPQAQTQQQSQ